MSARSARRRGRSIGTVLAELQPDFPELTISKIRFLEAEGLITPERTPSGYRVYSAADVERLSYILSAQRDRFWPLKVIREALDALERGLTPGDDVTPSVPAETSDQALPAPRTLVAPGTLRVTRSELGTASGLNGPALQSLESYGLLRADAGGYFGEADLAVARAAAALTAYGIEARHLRPFRSAAEREVALVEQALGPTAAGRDEEAHREAAADVLHHCLALHAALVRAEFTR